MSRQPTLVQSFYNHLYDAHPEAVALFTRHSTAQRDEMLELSISFAIDQLDSLEKRDWFGKTFADLGARHVAYGATPEMYAWAQTALVAAFRDCLADEWTPPLEAIWVEFLSDIVRAMIRGDREARG